MLIPIEIPTPIRVILQMIFHRYLTDTYCLTVVSDQNADVYLSSKPFIYINAKDTVHFAANMLNASELGCSDYYIQMKEPALFMDAFEENIHIGNARRSDRKLIFFPSANTQENIDSVLNILQMKGSQYTANILLILPTEDTIKGSKCDVYEIVTHTYVGPDNTNEPLILDVWDSCSKQFKKNINLFPHRDMTDLQGKVIRLACFTYKPYVLLNVDKSVAPLGYDGTELRIVAEFCRWLNCTIELVKDDSRQWGEIFENRTGNGVLGNIVEDRADVGITALYTWYHEYRFLDISMPGIRTGVTCIAPAPRLLASWELPVMPFSWTMWGAIVFTFFYSSFALTLAQRGSTRNVFWTTFGIFVTQTQPENVIAASSARYVVIWLLITGLLLDNAYGGGLATVFTLPKYERPIDTVQDLADANIEWGATHDAWVFSILLATEPTLVRLLKKFAIYNEQDLNRKGKTRDYAFSVERLPAGHYAIGEYITEETLPHLRLMREDIYWEQCLMMARKSSPYTSKYNKLLSRLHSSGLLLAWETQVVLKHSNFKVQLGVGLSQSLSVQNEVKALPFQNLMGIFILLGVGAIVSIIIFIGELIRGRHI